LLQGIIAVMIGKQGIAVPSNNPRPNLFLIEYTLHDKWVPTP